MHVHGSGVKKENFRIFGWYVLGYYGRGVVYKREFLLAYWLLVDFRNHP